MKLLIVVSHLCWRFLLLLSATQLVHNMSAAFGCLVGWMVCGLSLLKSWSTELI